MSNSLSDVAPDPRSDSSPLNGAVSEDTIGALNNLLPTGCFVLFDLDNQMRSLDDLPCASSGVIPPPNPDPLLQLMYQLPFS
ncbi:hypothetical protein L1887_19913 [Cichorium endivia]|nr:hypothetical protein L1887_19913 [Cichorium endivia]